MNRDASDEQLLRDFRAGEGAALEELARRYERRLLGLCLGLLGGHRELACDAVQEAWLRVIRFAPQFSERSCFKTWVYRITINQCRTMLAGEGRNSGRQPGNAASNVCNDPSAHVGNVERLHELREAVAQFGPEQRLVVLLCYHAGMTHTTAAEVLELPLGTLKSRLHAALSELRKRLGMEAPV